MSFSVVASVLQPVSVAATAGVESVLVTWDFPSDWTEASTFEVLSGPSSTIGDASLIWAGTETRFTEAGLAAEVERFFFVRVLVSYENGDVRRSSAVMASATPARAELGESQVQTVNVAPNAITSRAFYQDETTEYVRMGTDENNNLTPSGEDAWTLAPINFVGTGDTMVITCIARQAETPMIFRMGNSTVYALISCWISDVTDPQNQVLMDQATLYVSSWRVELMPISATSYISTGMNRDFYHNFIIETEAGHDYAITFFLNASVDDTSNYIMWSSDLRQVFWEIYKR